MIAKEADLEVKDAGLIAAAQRVEQLRNGRVWEQREPMLSF